MSTILPPLPDDLVERPSKDRAVEWIRNWQLPRRYARLWLGRWAAVTNTTLTAADYERVAPTPALPRS